LQVVKETIDPGASVEFKLNTADDPHMRKPDISQAKSLLNWEPNISLKQGLPHMVSDSGTHNGGEMRNDIWKCAMEKQ
jgi:UDP-glucuronate decarboxylase